MNRHHFCLFIIINVFIVKSSKNLILHSYYCIYLVNPNFIFRYPFHGAEHSGLFAKIRRGQFTLPDSLSSRAKCLIRCLLKKEPEERLTTEDVLVHPWLTGTHRERGTQRRSPHAESTDHCVPEWNVETSTTNPVDKFNNVFRSASNPASSR